MIPHLVLLGATGDLAGRLLLPALARLLDAGAVGEDLVVVGAAPQDLDGAGFARHVEQRLDAHAGDVPAAARRALVERLRYARVDLDDPASVAAAVAAAGDGPVAVYLALPPGRFAPAIEALARLSLPTGSRVVVEKPFGADAEGAAALNAHLERVVGGVDGVVFRVDHALAMPGTADLTARRGAGGDLAGVWHGGAIAQVDLLWEETLALEGRADFYDRAGAVRDVVQNHLLQLLAVAAGDLPEAAVPNGQDDRDERGADAGQDPGAPARDEAAQHAARLELLSSLRPAADAPQGWTRRARYTAGRLAPTGGAVGRQVPDYADEDGVDAERATETYAELAFVSTLPRWEGTRFVLRAGKALDADAKAVVVHLRDDAPAVAGEQAGEGAGRRVHVALDELSAMGERVAGEVSAYAAVLTDVLSGGSALSVDAAGSEQAWRVVAPALAAWEAGDVPLLEYPAGSAGPGLLEG